MTASQWHLRTTLGLIGLVCTFQSASAVPPTLNTSGLTPAQCYRRDSDCTHFCGEVSGDMRYECFKICDRMLERCLDTGEWTDSVQIDPDTGQPPEDPVLLSGFFMRMLMILADKNGDEVLSPQEINAVKDSVFRGVDAGGATAPTTPTQQ